MKIIGRGAQGRKQLLWVSGMTVVCGVLGTQAVSAAALQGLMSLMRMTNHTHVGREVQCGVMGRPPSPRSHIELQCGDFTFLLLGMRVVFFKFITYSRPWFWERVAERSRSCL